VAPVPIGPLTINVENPQGTERSNLDTTKLAEQAKTLPALAPAVEAANSGRYEEALKLANAAAETADPKVAADIKATTEGAWSTPMQYHYGRIAQTTANDGSGLDAFVKPGTPEDYSGPVYVIDQVDQKTGAFDEHKIFVGPASQKEAVAAYKEHYPKGWKVGTVSEVPMQVFNQWAKSAQSTKPFAERGPVALERNVTMKAVEAETGREAEVRMPAHEALSRLDESIQRAKDLLTCLSL
jgi:hypothetical protein